jgi:N-acetyl-gamma-glutamyl-phosphate reductase
VTAVTGIHPGPAPGATAVPAAARIALVGASGYSGQEFARLALEHPRLALAVLASREHAGAPAHALLPGLAPGALDAPVVAPDALAALAERGEFDTLVAALPHAALAALLAAQPALAQVPRIVDLSQDHRAAPGWVYGLPEAFRASLAGATRIANPGCYPTAATLAALPALEAGWLGGPVTVVALSGVSGAGRTPTLRTSYVEVTGGAGFYKVGEGHAHVPEMARTFARLAGAPVAVAFAPQLVPMARGILATVSAPLARAVEPDEAHAAWVARYAGEPFVHVLAPGEWPATHAVRGSNRCDVAVTTVHGGRTLVATAALDNLVKGAAGQAVQNLNVLLGAPETLGLPRHGRPW